VLIGYTPKATGPSTWRIAADPARNLLARWDAFWYLDIATRGYSWNGNPLEQQNVVFFPLFPMLMRASGAATGGHLLIAGLCVSLTAFLFALCYFWRWTADRLGKETATASVWLLSAFPLAIYFSAVYTESLYLLIAVAACYYAERRQFGRSAIAGLLGGLVRPNGFMLSVPVAWIAFVSRRESQRVLPRGAAAIAPVLGMLCYSAYLAWRVGDATAWLADQAAWSNIPPLQPPEATAIDLGWVPNVLPLGLVLASIAPVTSMLGAAYGLLVLANVAPPLLRHGLLSIGRFSSVMFPVFAWLATCVHGRARTQLVVAFAIGQAVLAALFYTWRAII